MTNDINNDLDWLAFCYAAGELDAADAEQFEARLADDQAAREALARAVELTQTVAAAESQCGDFVTLAKHTQSDWNRRISWMAVGGLASLLLALLWSGVVGPTWHKIGNASRSQLAMAWNQTRSEFPEIRDAALWSSPNDMDDDTADVAIDDMPDAPSWMMAAVFSVQADGSVKDQSTTQGLEQE
jgi:hypothetical protein